ncbi:hypothetical protein [Pinibacter soli]|uniref:Uncharacterized protein n=1 Tax=Pinibacter soli TaxID=3044211 RepID=A0ABT6RJD3_9BACT|nr:hypothetical protein [Pinibacter soli]MDI3322633.1 hypothetical protein [Pinibacter soli]
MNFNFVTKTSAIDNAGYYSLLRKMTSKLKQIQEEFGNIDSAELELYETYKDESEKDKVALLKLSLHNIIISGYSISKRWEDALLDAFDTLRSKMEGKQLVS